MTMNTFQKLTAIQSELKAPKGQYNSFGKYHYRSCEDILEAVKPLCKKYGASIIITDEVVMVGERYYVKAEVKFINTETGETLSSYAYAREEESKKGMDGSQVTGASSSYARKYALNGMFDIDDTKDSDSTNSHGHDVETPEKKTTEKAQTKTTTKSASVITDTDKKKLFARAKEVYGDGAGDEIKKLFVAEGYESTEGMPRDVFIKICKIVNGAA